MDHTFTLLSDDAESKKFPWVVRRCATSLTQDE